jgi:hypothetical protein
MELQFLEVSGHQFLRTVAVAKTQRMLLQRLMAGKIYFDFAVFFKKRL